MKRLLAALAFALPATAFAGQATLTWMDVPNETTFHIERAPGSCATPSSLTFAEIATVGANVLTYVDNGLPEGQPFCWRVAASNPAGKSPYSNLAGKTVEFTVPVAPGTLTVK